MQFASPLLPGTLIKRYKRFLADIRLDDGTEVTAHCANPGSMLGLNLPGTRVWVEDVADPKRKLRYSWKLVELDGGHLAGIDTSLPNRVVREALTARAVPPFAAYGTVRAEVKYAEKSRVDFLLSEPGLPDCYVEVKAVTLAREAGWAEFPDSVTARGARHMDDLAAMVAEGHRAAILYLVHRTDCAQMRLAADLDPAYAQAVARAVAAGVEAYAFGTSMDRAAVTMGAQLPVALAASL